MVIFAMYKFCCRDKLGMCFIRQRQLGKHESPEGIEKQEL